MKKHKTQAKTTNHRDHHSHNTRIGDGMPEEKIIVKKALFFRAYLLKEGARFDPAERDWADLLKRVSKKDLADRTIDGIIFEPSLLDKGALLGIHKPLNTDFMSQIDRKVGSVEDLMTDQDDDSPKFAYSTGVYFTGIDNVFALSAGNNQSPRANAVVEFLSTFAPPESGTFWKSEPLMVEDEIKKLRASKGVVEFSSKFSTVRNLFDSTDDSTGIVGFADKVANRVGADVEIVITVRLPSQSRSQAAKSKLRSLLVGDLKTLAGKGTGAKAKALVEGGFEEELSLVAHGLAAEFEMDQFTSESHQFSVLMKSLMDVSASMDDRVRSILRG